MNLDDLMAVWRSQDAAPLHSVDKTLLHLALRQEQAKLQAERRRERWIIYITSAGLVAGMTLFLVMMIATRERNGMTGWDFVIPIVGAAAAVVAAGVMYVNRRGQSRREQRFGESLRDELNRRIGQLDDQATRTRRTGELVLVVMGGICPMAIVHLGLRVNQESMWDHAFTIVGTIVLCVVSVAGGVWEIRRQVRKDVLPRKRRLEALLKELDAP